MFPYLKTFLRGVYRPSVAEVERDYLNAAVSRIDLERREREIERGLFRNGIAGF